MTYCCCDVDLDRLAEMEFVRVLHCRDLLGSPTSPNLSTLSSLGRSHCVQPTKECGYPPSLWGWTVIWILLLQGDLSLLPGVFNYLFISTWTLGYLFQTSGYNPIYFILLLKLFQFCLVGAFSVVPCVPLTCSHWCGLFFSCSNPRISHFLKNSGSFCWMTVLKTKIWVLSVPIATGMSSLLGPLSCQSKECMCV